METSRQLTFGSLFAGIGGFDLGFERAGMRCQWQVEIDPFCQKVLAKHWPSVRRWDDVRTFPPAQGFWGVDVVCGGFPCQDISEAGERRGIDGDRSGLWTEFNRIVRQIQPRFVVVENVAALIIRGLHRVLGDLAESGFHAEWDCLPAGAFGSRQFRDRIFIVATSRALDSVDRLTERGDDRPQACSRWMQDHPIGHCFAGGPWADESGLVRVAYGIPSGVDRCCKLGNAVVPQVAEWIGRRIVACAD